MSEEHDNNMKIQNSEERKNTDSFNRVIYDDVFPHSLFFCFFFKHCFNHGIYTICVCFDQRHAPVL